MFAVGAAILRPTAPTTPDIWAAENRVYPESAGIPGRRDPGLTPYMIPWGRAVHSGKYRRVVCVVGSQMGKTDTMLDVIGSRFDQRPAPVLYVGPNKEFLADQFEPRVMALLDEAKTLRIKVARGRVMKKTRKLIAGTSLRLAHAGSSAALKSSPAALALVDEYDEMLANIRGQGDPLGLVEARGDTYADFVTAIASTPSQGLVDSVVDPMSGLEFWRETDPDQIASPVWKLWQQGTRYHWAWPCPHCGAYFIPRFSSLRWPKHATPAQARRGAYVECPANGCVITDDQKAGMNARGVFVAPGQRIDAEGNVIGDPPDSNTWSMWTSGLASPFVPWGVRAETFLNAETTGEEDKKQTAMNASFGEVYKLGGGGEVPEWEEVKAKRFGYSEVEGDVPLEVMRVVMGVDVQKRSIIYVVRGFGGRGSSWLLEHGQLYGDTDGEEVWQDLWAAMQTTYDGLPVEKAFIDSGFRPDKPESGDEHRVYAFCREYPWVAFATKGRATMVGAPLKQSTIDYVNKRGKKRTLALFNVNSDHFKSIVHSKVRLDVGRPGCFYVPDDIDDDYCKQIVSEARVVTEGKPQWIKRGRDNHFLDCEALAEAAASTLTPRVNLIPEGLRRDGSVPEPGAGARRPADASAEEEDASTPPDNLVETAMPEHIPPPDVTPGGARTNFRDRFSGLAGRFNRTR